MQLGPPRGRERTAACGAVWACLRVCGHAAVGGRRADLLQLGFEERSSLFLEGVVGVFLVRTSTVSEVAELQRDFAFQ